MAAEPTKAIYVRVPTAVADRLDRAAERLGMSKRDIVTRLMGDRLEIEDDLQATRIWENDHPRNPGWVRAADENGNTDVLSLEEAAALLRVGPDDITELAESGEIPARKLGQQWRFSRSALLNWLRAEK
ncbi:MAG TPA: helix-turn-helix domain-containing protein [Mycobacteriales bacterium]|jgi:excisionase family DNA binding protein|nr:helix-turn-helix domain-containing protein [Mycobacteriales bacterium]